MRLSTPLTSSILALLSLPLSHAQSTFTTSTKRGLCFVPNAKYPSDNQMWVSGSSDLTWYYNYSPTPSTAYSNDSSFEFVPMLFSAPSSTSDTTFSDGIKALIKAGTNITHILSFNEPDGTTSTGGSDVAADLAAQTWIRELEPLRALGIKVGAPAVTGATTGFTWLDDFFTACNGSCTADFMPVHWYGNFEGLASNIGQKRAAYPNLTMWITEYALENSDLSDSQDFFNTTADYFDRIDYIDRYSYFGAFRSSASNVGPNVAMLTQKGKLTDIGSWYLGGAATNNVPKGEGSRMAVFGGWMVLVLGAAVWMV